MNDENRKPNFEFVSRVLPPVEFDMSGGKPIDPSMRNKAEFVSRVLPPVFFDMRVPFLVLTLRLSGKTETSSAEILALDVLNLIDTLSAYEKVFGGRGLLLHKKAAEGGAITLTLAPIAVDKAAARLNELAVLLGTMTARVEGPPQTPETPVLEAIAKLEQSPAEQCRAALARRSWSIEARVAMPV